VIFVFSIGPVFLGSILLMLAGAWIFDGARHEHFLGAQVMGAMIVAIGACVLFSLLRHIWRAFRAFFR
jgi:hypothetical protein